jgi:tetratricopeptide (TPR) repeat protein
MESSLKAIELQRRGMTNLLREEYSDAIDDLTLAIELKPTYPDINNALGTAHFFGGSKEMALEYFKRACEINPNYIEAQLHLAYTHIELGNLGEGVSILDDITQHPEGTDGRWDYSRISMSNLHAKLGQMYERRGELLEALTEYKRALKLQPGFLDTMLKLARTYAKLELFEEAHREFYRILRANAEYSEARMELGMLFMREGKYEEARKQWERCLGSEAHALRAKFYLKRLVRGEFKENKGYSGSGTDRDQASQG